MTQKRSRKKSPFQTLVFLSHQPHRHTDKPRLNYFTLSFSGRFTDDIVFIAKSHKYSTLSFFFSVAGFGFYPHHKTPTASRYESPLPTSRHIPPPPTWTAVVGGHFISLSRLPGDIRSRQTRCFGGDGGRRWPGEGGPDRETAASRAAGY